MAIFDGLKLAWMMIVSIFMFSMSVGFTMTASGGAFEKNRYSIMADYVLIICFVAGSFFFTSHTLTHGADGGFFGSNANIDTENNEELSLV